MKQLFFLGWVMLLLVTIGPGCKKKKDGCSEAKMKIETSPADGSVEMPGVGPEFQLTVTISENLPPSGVTIEVKARPEGPTSEPFFTDTVHTTSTLNNFTIEDTPPGMAAQVDITITSKTCNTNKWVGSYRYSRK